MKPIFGKTPPLGLKLFLAVIASLGLIASDRHTTTMIQARSFSQYATHGVGWGFR